MINLWAAPPAWGYIYLYLYLYLHLHVHLHLHLHLHLYLYLDLHLHLYLYLDLYLYLYIYIRVHIYIYIDIDICEWGGSPKTHWQLPSPASSIWFLPNEDDVEKGSPCDTQRCWPCQTHPAIPDRHTALVFAMAPKSRHSESTPQPSLWPLSLVLHKARKGIRRSQVKARLASRVDFTLP